MMSGSGEGVLAFERPGGGSEQVSASKVAAVLAEGRVPVVVLNACQSGAVGKDLEASVATALLQAGCAAVVAMAYSVYAVAAAEFMAAFYESLFAGASVGQAVTAGRRRLFGHDWRPSPKGDMPLADWLVPVHYLRAEVRFPQARTARPAVAPSLDAALGQIRATPTAPAAARDPLAAVGVFVGRDDLFYQLEAAARLQRVVVLAGPGGTGKTELAKGFARWWRDTGGVDDPRLVVWHSFEPGCGYLRPGRRDLRPRSGRVRRGLRPARPAAAAGARCGSCWRGTGCCWCGTTSSRSGRCPTRSALRRRWTRHGCAALKEFLDWVRDESASVVMITSRAREGWLGQVRRIDVGGLNRAEAAEYAGYLLAPFPAAQERRERRSFGDLLEWLDGHPLAMRLTLPRLDTADPAELLAGLRGTSPLPPEDDPDAGRTTSLPASITYSSTHLAGQTRRLLPAVSLFHGVVDEDLLMLMSAAEGVPGRFAGVSKQEWTAVLRDAARVGLLTGLGSGMYRIHPALPGYLAAGWHAEDPVVYAQEREACEQALCTACAAFSQWLTEQIESEGAAFAYAIIELQRRTLGVMLGHALDRHAWDDASSIVRVLDSYWATRGLSGEADAWADRILDATVGHGQTPPAPAQALWLYTTIRQATRQKNAGQPDQAGRTYRHALAYLQDQPETDWIRNNIAVIYHQLGTAAQARGQLDEAEDWYRKGLTIREERGDRTLMAAAYHQLGTIAQARGGLDEADDWYRKALDITEELGDRPHMAFTYHQLGLTAYARGRQDEAEDWYRKALAINEELGNKPNMANGYHALGSVAVARGRLDEAEDWYRKSLAINEELGNKPHIAMTYHQLGITARARGDWMRLRTGTAKPSPSKKNSATAPAWRSPTASSACSPSTGLRRRWHWQWNIRCVTLFDQFPTPMSGTGPAALARLTRQLGLPSLQTAWQQITGQPRAAGGPRLYHQPLRRRSAWRHHMTDPAADAARSAAAILTPDLGPNLPAEVEAALAARDTQQRPDRYFDPVSLASLIVAIATLAWTIYNDMCTRTPDPPASSIARQVRITLRDQDPLPPDAERITEVVATEIIRHARRPG